MKVYVLPLPAVYWASSGCTDQYVVPNVGLMLVMPKIMRRSEAGITGVGEAVDEALDPDIDVFSEHDGGQGITSAEVVAPL